MSSSVVQARIKKLNEANVCDADDQLAVEEPLEIRLEYGTKAKRQTKSISVTMRTPGNDAELAIGFLFTEGIVKSASEVLDAAHAAFDENIISVSLGYDILPAIAKLERNFYTTSSCGVCGKSSIDAVRTVCQVKTNDRSFKVSQSLFYQLPGLLRQQQDVFEHTGGLHASALFDISGKLLLLREDVGRHNALDKLAGAALKANMMPLDNHILLLSGRASFELTQKAAMAGIKVVAAVGAPSSLAVQMAKEFGITLVGFLRGERFNIYSGAEWIVS